MCGVGGSVHVCVYYVTEGAERQRSRHHDFKGVILLRERDSQSREVEVIAIRSFLLSCVTDQKLLSDM